MRIYGIWRMLAVKLVFKNIQVFFKCLLVCGALASFMGCGDSGFSTLTVNAGAAKLSNLATNNSLPVLFQNAHSGLCLHSASGILQSNLNLVQGACDASALLISENAFGSNLELRIAGTGYCLDAGSNATANASPVKIWSCDNSLEQRFTPFGSSSFRSVRSGKCFDIGGSGKAQIWSCDNSDNQLFTLLSLISPTPTPNPSPVISLSVQGAPNLALNGTSTMVSVGFVSGTPIRVDLSRDGFPTFASYPAGSFFSLSSDGKSLTGQWCISSSCWGNVSGIHILNVVATYANGLTANASVSLNVADSQPAPTPAPTPVSLPPPSGVEYTGVSASMWSEINSKRSSYGDPNDCQARINALPTSGGVTLQPGADINSALANNNVVFLSGGTYNLSSPINVPDGKKLIGISGQNVILNAINSDRGVQLGNSAAVANLTIDSAVTFGALTFLPGYGYTSNALLYRLVIRNTGYYSATSDGGEGIYISGDDASQVSAYNCIVSVDVSNTWNEVGGVNANGGNADGIDNNYGAHDNTYIDMYTHHNGDDGFDTWHGGVTYVYFSASHDNAKVPNKANAGNGNGFKLGPSSAGICGSGVVQYLYKVSAFNNVAYGIDINGNLYDPVLDFLNSYGNGYGADYTHTPCP